MSIRPNLVVTFLVGAALALSACEKKPTAEITPKSDGHAHDDGQHGAPIALGEAAIGPFKAVATRDDVPFKAGGDAPIDVTIDAAAAGTAKVAAVRFWIGTEDASGSIKAKADIEDPKQPNHWHTHAEVPDPLPAGAKLWVEIEDDAGKMHRASFELKQ